MNKLLILIAAFLMIIQFSNAQTEKGSQTLGFNFGFNSSKINEIPVGQDAANGSSFVTRYDNFNFGPSYSFFTANGVDAGIMLNFMSITQTASANNFGSPTRYNDYEASGTLFVRKYFLFKNKFGIRTGPYLSYGKSTYSYIYPPSQNIINQKNNSNNMIAGADLAMVYYATKNIGFAATLANLQYNHSTSRGGYQLNQNANSISFYTGTSALQISMFYIFGGKG